MGAPITSFCLTPSLGVVKVTFVAVCVHLLALCHAQDVSGNGDTTDPADPLNPSGCRSNGLLGRRLCEADSTWDFVGFFALLFFVPVVSIALVVVACVCIHREPPKEIVPPRSFSQDLPEHLRLPIVVKAYQRLIERSEQEGVRDSPTIPPSGRYTGHRCGPQEKKIDLKYDLVFHDDRYLMGTVACNGLDYVVKGWYNPRSGRYEWAETYSFASYRDIMVIDDYLDQVALRTESDDPKYGGSSHVEVSMKIDRTDSDEIVLKGEYISSDGMEGEQELVISRPSSSNGLPLRSVSLSIPPQVEMTARPQKPEMEDASSTFLDSVRIVKGEHMLEKESMPSSSFGQKRRG